LLFCKEFFTIQPSFQYTADVLQNIISLPFRLYCYYFLTMSEENAEVNIWT